MSLEPIFFAASKDFILDPDWFADHQYLPHTRRIGDACGLVPIEALDGLLLSHCAPPIEGCWIWCTDPRRKCKNADGELVQNLHGEWIKPDAVPKLIQYLREQGQLEPPSPPPPPMTRSQVLAEELDYLPKT